MSAPSIPTFGPLSAEQAELMAASVDDPVLFARNCLRSDLTPIQEAILDSIQNYPRTAVKSCHSSGKSYVAACAVLGFIAKWPDCVILTTAPNFVGVSRVLWGEIHSALARSAKIYPFPTALQTELRFHSKRYAIGLSTDAGVKLQGYHAEHVLWIIDEANGVDNPEVWDAIESARASGNVSVLAIGNPVISSGKFHECWANPVGWNLITVSAFDTPNLAGQTIESVLAMTDDELDANDRPYLISRRFVKEKYLQLGPDNPFYQSRILGNFPTNSIDALISIEWLESARKSTYTVPKTTKCRGGLDVAGPGEDLTVLTIRRGPQIVAMKSWPNSDPRGQVVASLRPYLERGDLESVNVDSAGLGWGMYVHLLEMGYPVIPVNVGERSSDTERFSNLKAQAYWSLRERFEAGDISGLTEDKAIGQLAGIKYKHSPRGAVQIESKEEARRRGVKSPDFAESICLAFLDATGASIFAKVFSDDLMFDPLTMGLGFGNFGSYQERAVAVAWGAALPTVFIEIIDDGKLIWVLREFCFDGARSADVKSDSALADDLAAFITGKNSLTGETVIRGQNDAVVILADSAGSLAAEVSNRGMYRITADEEILTGLQLVKSVFEKKLVRVSTACPRFIAEHQLISWDKNKLAHGVEEPANTSNAQTCQAFRHFVKSRISPWRLNSE